MYDVIKGLVLIHRKGFIHKDIKPDNIMITKNLKAKIGDFGIAIPIK
jgi:serine/threonine protein kinase